MEFREWRTEVNGQLLMKKSQIREPHASYVCLFKFQCDRLKLLKLNHKTVHSATLTCCDARDVKVGALKLDVKVGALKLREKFSKLLVPLENEKYRYPRCIFLVRARSVCGFAIQPPEAVCEAST